MKNSPDKSINSDYMETLIESYKKISTMNQTSQEQLDQELANGRTDFSDYDLTGLTFENMNGLTFKNTTLDEAVVTGNVKNIVGDIVGLTINGDIDGVDGNVCNCDLGGKISNVSGEVEDVLDFKENKVNYPMAS